MKSKDKIILAAFIILLVVAFIYLIRSILTPFVISLVVAYFLHPLVDKLCRKSNCTRSSATLMIVSLFTSIMIVAVVFILPIIYTQAAALIQAAPEYGKVLLNDIYPQFAAKLKEFGIKANPNLGQVIQNSDSAPILGLLQNFITNLFWSSIAIINILSLIFITPILIFYLLKDWDILVAKTQSYFPTRFANSAGKIMVEIDQTLSGYIRGQINVCLILGIIYSVLLSFTGLNFGILIGFLTGVFTFIPYVGAVAGFVTALIVALFQWGFDWLSIAPVLVVFLFGQTLETNFLTPKLIGKKVGLHPVWVIFGIFVFGVLFGFIGVLFATPLTAVCGVLIKHLANEYKKRIS